MKLKWWFPFLVPFGGLFLTDPYVQADPTGRALRVVGALAVCVALLAVLKPWRHDDGRDDGIRVGR